ncbi:hypothetical protein [Desulfonatronovibrio magnus]|uniref:hypothetical protein n=1 Tax=Desulfonatronovibrio magnus TaxID=698827 RepID=UPI0005EB5922|nr:hypothetical protein [Desulfonatronovibrio magnus]
MGLEVGWHLRFSKGDNIKILALKDARQQLENVLHIHPEWKLSIIEKNDHLEADFVRRKNIYVKD